ncbi:MAG: radical SAM protein [Thermodesulfobacteriota bacterium]
MGEKCPLSCRHCAYKGKKSHDTEPQPEILHNVWNSLDIYQPKWISLSGKEPTVFPEWLCKTAYRVKRPETHVILMTNGLLLHDELFECLRSNVDCFDISLDGDKPAHDWMRGEGRFEATWKTLSHLAKCEGTKIGVIATAVNSYLPDRRWQPNAILSLAKQMNEEYGHSASISLSISLYYGQPHDPLLLTKQHLEFLIEGLLGYDLPIIFLLTAHYSHMWGEIIRDLKLNIDTLEYEINTGVPVLQVANMRLIPFNMFENQAQTIRVSNQGKVYVGCNHLSWDDQTELAYQIGDLKQEPFEYVLRQFVNRLHPVARQLDKVPYICSRCEHWESCRGGDRISGLYYYGVAKDPYCPILNKRDSQ